MSFFRYVARDTAGKSVRGEIEAPDERALVNILRAKNLMIISIAERKEGAKKFKLPFMSGQSPLSELVLFSRQMATMVDAGIPLLQALEILWEQTENKEFRKTLGSVRQAVSAGSSLSQALAKQGDVFPEIFVNMIRAGEESGNLDEILDRLAGYMEKTAKLIAKVKSAMIYPSVVIFMALAITTLLLIKVIPVFKDMYADFDATLPKPTMILIQISDFLKSYIGFILVALIGIVITILQMSRTKKGGYMLDGLKLKLPVFGILIRKVSVSKFTRTLATLLRSGVPILKALEITAKTSGNQIVGEAIMKVRSSIREGENIAEPLRQSKVFPPMVVRMIGVGEKTGELEKMLNKIAEFYEEQVDAAVAGLTSIIEPMIIAFLGVVIGGIVICMFLPIFSLAQVVSG